MWDRKIKKLQRFSSYWQYRKKMILLWALVVLIYGMVLFAFTVPLAILLYGTLLVAVVLIVVAVVDYLGYRNLLTKLDRRDIPEDIYGINQAFTIIWEELEDKLRLERSEAINRMHELEDFYTLWAHQIKTPIAAMKLVLEDMEGEEKTIFEAETFRVEEYVQMMMAYLRMGHEGSDYVFRICSMDEVIKESIRKYAPLFIRKKITLHYEGEEHQLVTDPKWVGFVLDQILSNALKYTQEGSIHIYWKGKHTLAVADTGIGIPVEDLPRVVELGFTGYNGRIFTKSTGIGLHLCKRVMKNLGGDLLITSQVGEGTEIDLEFPKSHNIGDKNVTYK